MLAVVFPGHDIINAVHSVNPSLQIVQASSRRLLESFPCIADAPNTGSKRLAVDSEPGEMWLRNGSRFGQSYAIGMDRRVRMQSVGDTISSLTSLQMVFVDSSSNNSELTPEILPQAYARGAPVCIETDDPEEIDSIVRMAVGSGFDVFAIETTQGRVVQMPAPDAQPGILFLIPNHAWSTARFQLLVQSSRKQIPTQPNYPLMVPAHKALPVEIESLLRSSPSKTEQQDPPESYFLPIGSHVLGDNCTLERLDDTAVNCLKATGTRLQIGFIPPRFGEFEVRFMLAWQPAEPLMCFIDSTPIQTQWIGDLYQLVLLEKLSPSRDDSPVLLEFNCTETSADLGLMLKGIQLIYTADPAPPVALTSPTH